MDSLKVRSDPTNSGECSTDKAEHQETLNGIILNPQYAEYLALVKAARNGAVYGAKVRFPHALVYATPPFSRTSWTAQSLPREQTHNATYESQNS